MSRVLHAVFFHDFFPSYIIRSTSTREKNALDWLRPADWLGSWVHTQGADPPPLPLHVGTAGKNHLNELITLLATGIGKRYCQAMSNLGHAALLRRSELPL